MKPLLTSLESRNYSSKVPRYFNCWTTGQKVTCLYGYGPARKKEGAGVVGGRIEEKLSISTMTLDKVLDG